MAGKTIGMASEYTRYGREDTRSGQGRHQVRVRKTICLGREDTKTRKPPGQVKLRKTISMGREDAR